MKDTLLNWVTDFFRQDTTWKEGLFPFHAYLPYEMYDETLDCYSYGSTMGWVGELVPYAGVDDTLQKDLQALLEEILPEGSSLQVLLMADPCTSWLFDTWQHSLCYPMPLLRTMGQRRLDYLSPWSVCRDFRCIVSLTIPGQRDQLGVAQQLQAVKDHLAKAMEGRIVSLKPAAFLSFMDHLYNIRPDGRASFKEWNPHELLSHQIMHRETLLEVTPRSVNLCDGTIGLRTYTVKTFPDEWALFGMNALIGDSFNEWARLSCPFVLHYGIHVLPQEKTQEALFHKMKVIEHQGRSSHLLKVVPQLDREVRDAHHARSHIYSGEKLLWTQFSVGFWDKTENVERSEATLKSLFRSKHFGLEENKYLHACQYRSWMPMLWHKDYVAELRKFGFLKTTLSGEASHMLPILGEWKGTPTKGMPLKGRRGQLFFWYAFDNPSGNYNVVVVGRSGSGKSVFMQELLVSTLRLGGRVFVLDVGRSFEKTCLLLEGQFIAFDKSTTLCLNPFTNIPLHDLEVQDDMFAMMKSLLAMMAAPTQSTTDYENGCLEKAIKQAWLKKGQDATITDVADWLLEQEGEDGRESRRLGTMLTPYTKDGVYARYFEGRNNVDFTNPMVVIELEELKEKKDLQCVVLQMFIMTITSQMFLGDRRTPFHICIDEAWDLLRGTQTGPFIETLARRLRKYNGSLVIGTQSVEDFYQTAGAQAAYDNSDWMCLLSQKTASIERLKENKRLSIDAGMEAALKSLKMRAGEYSEVLIHNAQEGYAIGQLCLDHFSALLYSTKAEDYERVNFYRSQGNGMAEAIETVLQERHPDVIKNPSKNNYEKNKEAAT